MELDTIVEALCIRSNTHEGIIRYYDVPSKKPPVPGGTKYTVRWITKEAYVSSVHPETCDHIKCGRVMDNRMINPKATKQTELLLFDKTIIFPFYAIAFLSKYFIIDFPENYWIDELGNKQLGVPRMIHSATTLMPLIEGRGNVAIETIRTFAWQSLFARIQRFSKETLTEEALKHTAKELLIGGVDFSDKFMNTIRM